MTIHSRTYALDTTWRPLLRDLGVEERDILGRAGLPHDLLLRDPARLEPDVFYRFWAGLGAVVGDDLLPLRLCETLRGEVFSPALFAALSSPNLLVAAGRIARYKRLVAPTYLAVSESAAAVTLEVSWSGGITPPPSLALAELLFFVALARMGTREMIRPTRVETMHPPTSVTAYATFLGVSIVRGRHHRIAFRREDAVRPFLTSSETRWEALEPVLRTRLEELDAGWTMRDRVSAVLVDALPSGTVAVDTVARRLALSRRTLQRRLAAEGTTFIDVVRVTRESLAYHYLEHTRLPINEIAFLLGSEAPNSFFRAFRDWTGKTPEQVRAPTGGGR